MIFGVELKMYYLLNLDENTHNNLMFVGWIVFPQTCRSCGERSSSQGAS